MTPRSKPTLFPLILALIVFGVTGWYGVNKYQEVRILKAHVQDADVVLLELEKTKTTATRDYQDMKKSALDKASTSQEKLASVFPSEEDLTGLTRVFDNFAFKNHYQGNPFFINQLTYGTPTSNETLNAMVTPITINLETSERNLFKFLEFIETSGSTQNGVRLMSTNGINIQLSTEESEVMHVQLTLQAYIQQ